MDAHANFPYSIVAAPPSPATSGLSLVLQAGTATRFPSPTPFNAVVWPEGEIALPNNAEIVRVTNIASNTLTIVRAQEGTTARAIVVGDQIAAMVTKKTLTDIEGSTLQHFGDVVDAVTPWGADPGIVTTGTAGNIDEGWIVIHPQDDESEIVVGFGNGTPLRFAALQAYGPTQLAGLFTGAGNGSEVDLFSSDHQATLQMYAAENQGNPFIELHDHGDHGGALLFQVAPSGNNDNTGIAQFMGKDIAIGWGKPVANVPPWGEPGFVDPDHPNFLRGWIVVDYDGEAEIVVGYGSDSNHGRVQMVAGVGNSNVRIHGTPAQAGVLFEVDDGGGGTLLAITPSGNDDVTGTISIGGCDVTWNVNTVGPVLVDKLDGHTYRLVVSNGVLGTVQVS